MEIEANKINGAGKAAQVRAMFADIAPRYDFLNHALSLNTDKRWRRFVISKVADRLAHGGALALDLCCGTADLSLELGAIANTLGIDFCHPMLKLGLDKVRATKLPIELVEGDALRAPIADGAFDVVTMAFGLRNLESVEGGLREIHRLLKRGGRAAVLEFSRPQVPIFRGLFHFYFTRVLPRIGNAISGSQFAYRYLPESVLAFPDQKRLATMMRAVGFSSVSYYNLFGGVAALHVGDKP
ncbi:MAG TPA: bifunctional demethylmenaquinone methyltransferase/2-methoxy-6-polyprenyl-1,4-benzoquinol methylase UbiE [Blastocatellia bacterium]|jgi:demethylmenaquinone methyltransferase/2-methoxy-6-polyprenyl-1,4-benzoquinol methylase|nr:bifunctional demethylmenaquinone methyltransferase/2-methoxy-6-polyprenyl-1,4-benzoquinol methylase UbiE [Blastocatellia bacterium]